MNQRHLFAVVFVAIVSATLSAASLLSTRAERVSLDAAVVRDNGLELMWVGSANNVTWALASNSTGGGPGKLLHLAGNGGNETWVAVCELPDTMPLLLEALGANDKSREYGDQMVTFADGGATLFARVSNLANNSGPYGIANISLPTLDSLVPESHPSCNVSSFIPSSDLLETSYFGEYNVAWDPSLRQLLLSVCNEKFQRVRIEDDGSTKNESNVVGDDCRHAIWKESSATNALAVIPNSGLVIGNRVRALDDRSNDGPNSFAGSLFVAAATAKDGGEESLPLSNSLPVSFSHMASRIQSLLWVPPRPGQYPFGGVVGSINDYSELLSIRFSSPPSSVSNVVANSTVEVVTVRNANTGVLVNFGDKSLNCPVFLTADGDIGLITNDGATMWRYRAEGGAPKQEENNGDDGVIQIVIIVVSVSAALLGVGIAIGVLKFLKKRNGEAEPERRSTDENGIVPQEMNGVSKFAAGAAPRGDPQSSLEANQEGIYVDNNRAGNHNNGLITLTMLSADFFNTVASGESDGSAATTHSRESQPAREPETPTSNPTTRIEGRSHSITETDDGSASTNRSSSHDRFEANRSLEFRLGKPIGGGGFGLVYEALDTRSGELLAVKQITMRDGSDMVSFQRQVTSLTREIETMRMLNHPNIVRFYGVAKEDTRHVFLIMELAAGGSVLDLLSTFGPLAPSRAIEILRDVLRAIEYVHSHGLIHCDLKCANLLLGRSNEIKLADFGTTRRVETVAEGVAGTLCWMSPEVVRGKKAVPGSDIWGVGCVAIEMMTGRPPFLRHVAHNDVTLMLYLGQEDGDIDLPPEVANADARYSAFVRRCLQRDASLRPSASELLQDPLFSAT